MTIRSDLKRAAEAVMGMDYPWDHTVRDGRLGKTSTEYARLAHPSNVLALIEHNELLTARLCECKSCGGEGDLHSGDWHHYGHMEPPEPVMEKCGECDGSGRIGDIQDLDNSLAEIQRLKAENESANSRLHEVAVACATAEQERDQLKAECEGLRKHAPSSEIIWCECGDGYPANSYGAGFMAANDGVCENCDAAKSCGSGEGSKVDETPAQQGSACRSEQHGGWTAEDEASSRTIYEQWANLCEYVPWVEGGNSLKQEEARRMHCAIEGKAYCYGR